MDSDASWITWSRIAPVLKLGTRSGEVEEVRECLGHSIVCDLCVLKLHFKNRLVEPP